MLTDNPNDPRLKQVDPKTGLQAAYIVLSDEERAKGFVRPVRESYKHVGARPQYPLRDLTDAEREEYGQLGYMKYETYPESERPMVGRYWTQAQLSGCGTITTMARELAETYARDPKFYGATYCTNCRGHFRVGEDGEFEWLDGSKVGT